MAAGAGDRAAGPLNDDFTLMLCLAVVAIGLAFFGWLSWTNYHGAISAVAADVLKWQIQIIHRFTPALDGLYQTIASANFDTVTISDILTAREFDRALSARSGDHLHSRARRPLLHARRAVPIHAQARSRGPHPGAHAVFPSDRSVYASQPASRILAARCIAPVRPRSAYARLGAAFCQYRARPPRLSSSRCLMSGRRWRPSLLSSGQCGAA